MKLCYRGIEYDYNPPSVAKTTADVAGKYRGVDVRFRNRRKPLVLPATLNLKYRGVAYRPSAQPAVQPAAPAAPQPTAQPTAQPAFALQARMRELALRRDAATRQRQQTVLNRLMSEVGVTGDVQEYWKQFHRFVQPGDAATYGPSAAGIS